MHKVVFDETEAKLSLERLLGRPAQHPPNRRVTAGRRQVTRNLRRANGRAEQWIGNKKEIYLFVCGSDLKDPKNF